MPKMQQAAVNLLELVLKTLDQMKGLDILWIDVSKKTAMTDYMVMVSGTSIRHVKSMAINIVADAKAVGFMPLGVEGLDTGEWVLVDLNSLVVHVMIPNQREFYGLEELWSLSLDKMSERYNIEH